jgi:hypothetical protein
VRVVDAFLGIEGAGAVAAGTGDHIPHVLEQPVRLVLRIGQQAQPLRPGPVEDQLDVVAGLGELLLRRSWR